jgi:hypothetical protein
MVPLGTVQVKEEFKLDSEKTQSFAVSCDTSIGLPISGGYSTDREVILISSQPEKNGWQITLSNQTKARKTVSVYANCLIGFSGKAQTTHIEKTVEGRSIANLKLGCQIAGKVIGGGFDLSDAPNLVVTESRLVGNEWVISVINPSRNKQTFNAYAQCLSGSGLPALTAQNDTVKIPARESKVVELNCVTVPISGGNQAPIGLALLSSRPTAIGWIFEVENTTQRQLLFKPQAICVGPSFQKDSQRNSP